MQWISFGTYQVCLALPLVNEAGIDQPLQVDVCCVDTVLPQ